MDTTRRYARSMREAFPQDASYACAIEAHKVPFWDRAAGVALAICIGVAGACVLVAALS